MRRYNGMSIEILNPSGGGGVVVHTGRCPDADGAVLALTSTRLQVGGSSSFVSGVAPVLASAFLFLPRPCAPDACFQDGTNGTFFDTVAGTWEEVLSPLRARGHRGWAADRPPRGGSLQNR